MAHGAIFCLNAETVDQLIPPRISPETISQKIVCTRPMRNGSFNISLERVHNKSIINCNGHGGSGATTVFGSIEKAIQLFEQENRHTKAPIRVIGSGYMGLTAAIELVRRGHSVSGITTKDLYDLPSWKAAGYFALVSIKTSEAEQENLNQIGLKTFLTYSSIMNGTHPYLNHDIVRYMPVYCSQETEAGVEDLERRGLIPPHEIVTLDFGNGVLHKNYKKFMTYFINTSLLMQGLHAEVNRLGIPIEIAKINAFSELQEEVIFNCTGLGARELNNDELIIPVQGHLITLNQDSGVDHMDYMIYTKVEQDGKDEYIYLFPKTLSITMDNPQGIACNGVLGGTFLENTDRLTPEEQKTLNTIEFDKLLERNSLFFSGKSYNET